MSGTFDDIDVPPTLVSFAVGYEKAERIISPEFKKVGSKLVLLMSEKLSDGTIDMDKFKKNLEVLYSLIGDKKVISASSFKKVGSKLVLLMSEKLSDGTIDMDKFKKNLEVLYSLIGDKKVISASSLKFGGAAEALTKMSLGNRIGAKFSNLTVEELFGLNYGTLLLEVEGNVDVPTEFAGTSFKVVGETISEERIVSGDYDIDFTIEELEKSIEEKLNGVFKISTEKKEEKVESKLYTERNTSKPRERIEHPKVVIPVFPGTNCEDDCARAFMEQQKHLQRCL